MGEPISFIGKFINNRISGATGLCVKGVFEGVEGIGHWAEKKTLVLNLEQPPFECVT